VLEARREVSRQLQLADCKEKAIAVSCAKIKATTMALTLVQVRRARCPAVLAPAEFTA